MINKLVLILLIIFMLPAGCIKIPEQHKTLGNSTEKDTVAGESLCAGLPGSEEKNMVPPAVEMLDSRGFSLINWNSYKGKDELWQMDLDRLISEGDIVTLQEGYLTDQLQQELQQHNLYWDLAAAFRYNKIPIGVLTASRVEPDYLCSFRVKERLTGIPKTILITRYFLTETDDTLLLVNIHMVNLSFAISAYRRQLDKTAAVLAQHRGPMIVSGDFNSWSEERSNLLQNFAVRLHLKTVQFADDKRSLFFGRPVDYVFYRGLVPQYSSAGEVTTSDHNPMLVTFSLANEYSTGW